ncbi:hypothetical protein [Methylomonas koyamae]|uniref:Uncharacterized protein n=1 Tax=Methylomonas koyamae TaxID=702114 RepID=A0A177NK06_9GAMM|nr:hypothetical protein [Methylomonas koyamae]OAI17529.1 hypothetical protein A1355_07780 [Methylomonas koyamae]
MSDKKLVLDAGIHSAIIVDDGYDETPQVAELLDQDGWDILFDDAQGDEAGRIVALFPDYVPENREELKSNQEFVDALWQGRGGIQDLLGGLFDVYEQKIQDNRPFLETVETALHTLGIPFETCGRDFVEAAIDADLIIIDLFLGIQQGAAERQLTVDRLKEIICRRDHPLPSIVLMSQVPGIDDLAKQFRQDVQLHASTFRHVRKNHLLKVGRMEGLILTLASHRSDSQALAKFVETWEKKAIEAVSTATETLRKIDIDDLQHIRSMLLRFEGLNTSSYLLDVFDRVLQYEIESHSEVLDAASRLDEIADAPAPLMISNDRDTYTVLEQTLFVNPKRRCHATGAEWPITFGDILGPNPRGQIKPRGFFSGRTDLVFFVASPECDLIRKDGLTTALLVAGALKEIDITKPDLAVTAKTTPVVTLDEGRRFQIDWNFGDLRTINLAQIKRLIHPVRGDVAVFARLREGAALSLRQQFLSNVGRVGELAPLPRSLKFRANLFLPLQQGGTERIEMPDGVTITGNVLIPRRGKFATAIIDSNSEEDLTAILLSLDLQNVASKSKRMFETLREQTRIRQIFRSGFQGLDLPLSEPRSAGLLKLGEEQPNSDEKKPKIDKVATIVKGADFEDVLGDKTKEAGLILQIHIESDS